MDLSSRYIATVSGQRRGVSAHLSRLGLGVAGWMYGRAVGLRNAWYDTWAMPRWLDVPVVSVGNLTVGGTGKTPMTLWVAEQLLVRGRKPAILARGYKADARTGADELLLLSRRCPQAVAIANPDRYRSGMLAIEQYQAQAAVLDDGFQHRRLGRDLDIVLIDATRPFGFGHILPRGLLRESVTGVRRADAVVLTRCDQVEAADLEAISREVRRFNKHAPIVRSVHRFAGFTDLQGRPVAEPSRETAGCFAGIARPDAFVRTLSDQDYPPQGCRWFDDHHLYSEADVAELCEWARYEGITPLITTEKDAVKLVQLQEVQWPVPVVVLTIAIEFLADGDKIVQELLDEMLRQHADPDAPKEDNNHADARSAE